ncbi:Aldehyde dehydrogenase [Minicystis rosea]|nr:Aldehyde dehydrogenase [Minicystis rosea]
MVTQLASAQAETALTGAMRDVLEKQRAAFVGSLPVGLDMRRDRLSRALDLLRSNKERLAKALAADYGKRSEVMSMLTDIMSAVKPLEHAQKHVDRWMKPEKRRLDFPLGLLGARARVEYQPKGVIGVMGAWNFPVALCFAPLAQIFAAGNRAMVKPSEYTPETSALMADLVAERFDESELAFFLGGPDVGEAFASLPFDHLIFTGGTGVARHILRAAAEHLVPTTLELGGKSPVIVGESADIERMAARVAMGKMMNAGQICLAPDYMLVPETRKASVIDAITQAVTAMYPTLLANDDYTAIINRRHRDRLDGLLEDARKRGAEIITVNPAREDFGEAGTNKMPLHLITGVDDGMRVMKEEIFGPVLPIMTHARIDDAIAYVNRHDRPLALYYFGEDEREERHVLERTVSGGVTVNDVIFHISAEDLPFGGIGPSGMGCYHGFDGFRTFSHAKAIYRQPKLDLAGLAGFKPPYGDKTRKSLKRELG